LKLIKAKLKIFCTGEIRKQWGNNFSLFGEGKQKK